MRAQGPVGVYPCHSANNQQWTILSDGIESVAQPGACVAYVAGPNSDSGTFYVSGDGSGDITLYGLGPPDATQQCIAACY